MPLPPLARRMSTSRTSSSSTISPAMRDYLLQRRLEESERVASLREMTKWCAGLSLSTVTIASLMAWKKKKPTFLLWLPVCGLATLWLWDAGYGERQTRIREAAGGILDRERGRFVLPENTMIMSQDEYMREFVERRNTSNRK